MKIMIDYDNTYTADVDMWKSIIPIFLQRHKVYLVTSREPETPVEMESDFVNWEIPIIYCSYMAKKDVCLSRGINIDIWIDDDPYYINTGFVSEDTPITLIRSIEKNYR